MRKLFWLLLCAVLSIGLFAQSSNGNRGAGGSTIAPNQNFVYVRRNCPSGLTNCFQSSSGDNGTVFASALAYANALTATTAFPQVPSSIPAFVRNTGSSNSITTNVGIGEGTTSLVFFADSLAQAATVTPNISGSTFAQLGATISPSSGKLQVYATSAGAGHYAYALTLSVSSNEIMGLSAITLPISVSTLVAGTGVTGSSTSPSISYTTTAANSLVVTSCIWYASGGTDALTNVSGTIYLNNSQTTTSQVGQALWATYAPASGTVVTTSGTLGTSAPWGCQSIEAKQAASVPITPTVDIAQGYYNYSSGLSLTQPITLKCEPGTYLDYTGSAHAVDIGAQGLVSEPAMTTTTTMRYVVDGCTFLDGTNMTEGLYMQPYNHLMSFRNNTFKNFGNASAYMIYGACENWDVEVGPQNAFYVYDGQPRNIMLMNGNHCTGNSFARVHDNGAFCWGGANVGCDQSATGTGFIFDGSTNRFYHNNIAFWKPDAEFLCNNPFSGTTCLNNQATDNQMESPATGATTVNVIQFNNQDGMILAHNTILVHSTGASPIGPVSGTDILSGSRINFNTISQLPAATPVVALNNVANQSGNISYQNECITALAGPHLPCPLVHTTGGSITSWNTDSYPSCTLNGTSGTCTANFSETYGVAQKCTGTWNGTGTLTGILKVVGGTSSVVATSSVTSDTAVIQMTCSAGDGQ